MSAPTRREVLRLYTSTLRTARSFASYNFRQYFVRRTRTTFREFADLVDPSQSRDLFNNAVKELEVLKRAAVVNRLYEGQRLVVEKPRVIIGGGGSGMEASVGGGGQPV